MYLIATHLGPLDERGFYPYSSSMLHEVTTKAERAELEARYDRVSRVDYLTAHRWVRDGNTHSTYLYIDEGKVRRASSGE
jgi:hypothetical protein